MELAKIRSLSDLELTHQEKTSSEQLFRLRFQVSMGQNDGVKKLRQLRKEIAQIKTMARERELGIHGEQANATQADAAEEAKTPKAKAAAPAAPEPEAVKVEEAAPVEETKTRKTKKAAPAVETKTAKAKGARK
jgi:large subunit ribosomal protein L29